MKETVTDPLLFFLVSILFGVCLQAIYDIIRGIRRVFYHKSVFLFIEDIAEPPYKIERMLYNLKLSGRLASLSGLIVGRFTEYTENEGLGGTLYELIRKMVDEYDYPVCFDFPVGHVSDNLPMIEGADVVFSVGERSVDLSFCIK